jgi:hypothetical protein
MIDIPTPDSAPGSQERFIAELRRINAETEEFISESRKLRYDPLIAAFTAGAAVVTAFGAVTGILWHFSR